MRMYIAIHAELFTTHTELRIVTYIQYIANIRITTHTELRIVTYIQYIANIRITLYQESIIEKRVSNSTMVHQK